MNYVEQFQLVEAAMVLAKVTISDLQKTLQFVKGIKDMSYRCFILEKAPIYNVYCFRVLTRCGTGDGASLLAGLSTPT
eukprot:3149488-Rhodomonas_salina.1